jgi:hypothetical protein
MALTDTAHQIISQHCAQSALEKVLAIDATCGNGYDTEFLCSLGFEQVLAFDIQQRAIAITRHRLQESGLVNAQLLCKSHDQIEAEVLARAQRIDCAMFNLGYLPHGDKTITTQSESTLVGISQTMNNLSAGGIITILCYPGHENGAKEHAALAKKFESLSATWAVRLFQSQRPTETTPVLYALVKSE